MLSVKQMASNVGDVLVKHSPAILTGIGCAGVVSTCILGCHATTKATTLLKDKKTSGKYEYFTWKEKFLLTWKLYIPTAISGAASIACIIGANSVNSKRQAAIASLYALSETALKEYKEEVKTKLKPKQLNDINEAIVEKRLEDYPIIDNEVILTEKGNTLCFDNMSSRYFRSDIETIRRIQNDMNEACIKADWVNLNDFYFSLGLEGIKYGDEMGWSASDQFLDIRFTSKVASNGEPCLVLDYDILPRYF